MKRLIYCVIFTLVLTGFSPLHAATRIWQKEFTATPYWQRLTTDGNLMVSNSSGLAVYRGSSGEQLWQRSDLWATSASDIRFLGQSGLLLAEAIPKKMLGKKNKKRAKRKKGKYPVLRAIDVLSGEQRWTLDFLRGDLIDIRVIDQHEIAFVFQSVKVKRKDTSGIYLTALNLADGKVLWETQFADRRTTLTSNAMPGLAAHSRITVQKGVAYVPFLGLQAIDMNTGDIKWRSAFRKKIPQYMGTYAPPVVDDSKVYVSDTGVVYAFDKFSGKQLWRAKVRHAGVIPELQETNSILLARFGGTFSNRRKIDQLSSFGVAGIDLATGKVLWNFDDARKGITNLVVQENKNRIIFADAADVLGVSIQDGELLFAAPLAFYRRYGIFKVKKSGFSIAGGFSKTTSAGTRGKGGGLGGGSCRLDIGDLPIDIYPKGEEVVIRGQSHIMTFDPRVMLVQWSAIFSDTNPSDKTLLNTGALPVFSHKEISYYLTAMNVSRGRQNHEQLIIIGIAKADGKVKSRLDIPGRKPRLIIDYTHDLLYLIQNDKKRRMQLTTYAL